MIEFEFGTSVRASEHHAMLVPISSIVSVEPWPDTTEARVTLVDGRVLWVPEGYVALVARIREALDHGMFPGTLAP